ncbi:helix-turn-helix domain-containing protein [Spirochaeta cellobiosiphila]|uniref:helix-turn-helix domain-containing protein n=1 Tax=Spirochaeta cellobiosiphila TaxID=504483 RepID=UPI00040265BD|nr:helix-turn-helix domain-containing protein [Spirochaeta cellobiosiphila]
MMDGTDNSVYFKNGFFVKVNDDRDPLFYMFDYGVRTDSINMEFQHFHDFYELYFLLDDQSSHIIEGDYFNLQRYDIVLLKPAYLHMTKYPKGESPKARLVVDFRIPDNLPGMEKSIKQLLSIFEEPIPIFRFKGEVRAKIINLFNEIYMLGVDRHTCRDLMIHCKFIEILWTILDNRKENCYAKKEITDTITQKVYEVTSYLHVHYPEEISLQAIAERFYVSPYYLSHQFKRVTGSNFVSYLQQIRIRNAQQLLLYTNKKIKDICEECGFSSFSQFNRVFSKFCHITPSLFRQNKEHKSEEILRSMDPERHAKATPSKALQSFDDYIAVKHKNELNQK